MNARVLRPPAVVTLAAAWGFWVCAHTYTRWAVFPPAVLDGPILPVHDGVAAAVRAASGGAGALLVIAAALGCGALLIARRRDLFGSPGEWAVTAGAVGAAALGVGLAILGVLGLYRPIPVVALLVGLGAVGAVDAWRGWRGARQRQGPDGARTDSAARRWHADPTAWMWVGCSGLGLSAAAVGAFAPEIEYDALWYHLWLPARALAAGAPVDSIEEYIALYPLGWELLNGAAMVWGGPTAAKLLHFVCLPLLAASACLLARVLTPAAPRALVFALVVCVPTVLWEASTAYVDLALAWLLAVAVLALLRFHATADRRWLPIAGVVLGGAMSVKHLAVPAALCAVAAIALRGWRSNGSPQARVRGPRALDLHSLDLRAALLVGGLALLVALPWYVRAYRASGNPVFPEAYRVFGAEPDTRWSEANERGLQAFKDRFGLGRGPTALALLPWNVTTHGARFGGAVGPLFLILAPFALLSRAAPGARAIVAGSVAYVGVWASPLGSFQLRFLLPLVPFAAIAAAAGYAVVARHAALVGYGAGVGLRSAVGLLLVLNLPPFTEFLERDRRGWEGWLTHVLRAAPLAVVVGAETEAAYLSRTVPTYQAWQFIDHLETPPGRVLTFSAGDQFYSRARRIWSESTLARPATWGAAPGGEAAMFQALAQLGVTHLLVDRKLFGQDADLPVVLDARVRRCCLTVLFDDGRVWVASLALPSGLVSGRRQPGAVAPASADAGWGDQIGR